jgi:hypothetical protein
MEMSKEIEKKTKAYVYAHLIVATLEKEGCGRFEPDGETKP